MTEPAFRLAGVAKSYGAVAALRPFDLDIAEGEFVTLLGPSGSGKTTLLGIAAGIVAPDAGHVFSRGADITSQPPHLRNVGMVFQRYTLFPNKTVAENVAFPLEVRHVPPAERRERVAHFLDLVGLGGLGGRYPSQVSGGQAQRVALARALVFSPALLLMDEPLGAIDRRLRQVLQEEIRSIQQQTRTPTMYVTHDQDEAMSMSDRIVIMRDGGMVAADTPRRLYAEPVSVWAAEFLGDANVARVVEIEALAGGACICTTQTGERFPARLGAPGEGQPHVIVRPEDCVVRSGAAGEDAPWAGEVLEVSFRGPMQVLRIRLQGGWPIRAALPARQQVAVGDTVQVGWDASVAIVVRQ